jgi:hypothetical protein
VVRGEATSDAFLVRAVYENKRVTWTRELGTVIGQDKDTTNIIRSEGEVESGAFNAEFTGGEVESIPFTVRHDSEQEPGTYQDSYTFCVRNAYNKEVCESFLTNLYDVVTVKSFINDLD